MLLFSSKNAPEIIPDAFFNADFVVIDFETATAKRNSACALGMVAIEDCSITATYKQLIQPPGNDYLKMNINIHGITPEMTRRAPNIAEIYTNGLDKILTSEVQLAAHNASFDMSVLRSSLEHHKIETPWMDAICTVDISRELFPQLKNHKLKTVSKHINHTLDHHDPLSDARAAAAILMQWIDVHSAEIAKAKAMRILSPYIDEHVEKFHLATKQAKELEKENPTSAARLYMETINLMKNFDIHCRKHGITPERPRMSINRLSMVLERNGMLNGCLEAITWYRSYPDPIGLNASDEDAINKRLARVEKKIGAK